MSERRSLTPLESELRIDPVPLTDERPSLLGRFHAWRARREPPTTRRGVIAHGLLRLTIALGVATGLAFLVDHFKGGNTAVGFYIVGAALLAVAFMTSATSTG